MSREVNRAKTEKPTFIDVFAGCGGLSVGLFEAGWQGIFAIERDRDAFKTLEKNLLCDTGRHCFNWPAEIPSTPLTIESVLLNHRDVLKRLAGNLDLLVGGPPCQGFSSAGRRDPSDPRNQLVRSYLQLVDVLRPRIVLIENVRGITADFKDSDHPDQRINYAEWLQATLAGSYQVSSKIINTSQFGVPQRRSRYFVVAIRDDLAAKRPIDPFELIERHRLSFLKSKSIHSIPVSAKSAISDLEISRAGTSPSRDSKGFVEIAYSGPRTGFQRLMNSGLKGSLGDTRLARHKPPIVARFKKIIALCHADGRLNTSLSRETRESFGLLKCAIRVLDPNMPSPTITSMPDDLIHYSEPRCLTVRENARLQSFPDWFEFQGKYTTGGDRRRKEVPRFTQVANAVPPLIAEAIGVTLKKYILSFDPPVKKAG